MSNLEILEKLSKDDIITTFEPICIRQKSNWSKIKREHKLDNKFFDANVFLNDIKNSSPKLDVLLKKIADVDRNDENKYGKKFKHFIFSDLKSGGHGAKMLAAGLMASGWTMGYKANRKDDEDDDEDNDKEDEDNDDKKKKGDSIWGPIELLSDNELLKTRGDNFYLLSSVSVFDKPISVKMKKEILTKFNSRPDNIHGDLARIIVMDSGFKEGIDLFDIKYIHIFEPSVNESDQKQVIGRGTRTCGQKGLEFSPTKGWPLHVFVYDLEIPGSLQSSLMNATSTFDLFMKSMSVDIRLINFGYDIERLSYMGSIDYELNDAVHSFSISDSDNDSKSKEKDHLVFGGEKTVSKNPFGYEKMKSYIHSHFGEACKWADVKMENMCLTKGGESSNVPLQYTPTQEFIRQYFTPSAPVKGLLLHHSVGTGKTCTAIAAASTNFEPEGYTILWVTRTTLKNDIWKNMFGQGQVCNESIRNKLANGEKIPEKNPMRVLSKAWRIRPMSYKQFSNLVSKQNNFYRRLVAENGEADPLRKTLLIIDEAHKLYGGGDLSSLERPDMVALHESLMRSYAVSGEDSVRLLLMTATPITESPMEMVQLLNLCKPIDQQMPHTFESFSTHYLDDEGQFTHTGKQAYLDDIAGHISYLNRGKDARQFAQPIVKRIMVPIVSDDKMDIVKKYDKYILRSAVDENLTAMKERAQEAAEKMDDELSEMQKERFQYLKKKCSLKITQKTCNKIVNSNISKLVSEIKTYVASIKDQIKKINSEIKAVSKERTRGLESIKKNIEKHPKEFEDYQNSTYFSLRTICGKRVRTNKELLENLKTHPKIVKYNNAIRQHEEHIEMMKNKLKMDNEAYTLRLKQLRDFLRRDDISDLEQSVIRLTIKDHQKNFRKTKKRESYIIQEEMADDIDAIKLLEDNKKEVYQKIRKTMKTMIRQEKKEIMKTKKEEKRLRKTMRKQSDIKDDIKDESIHLIVKKYEDHIDNELSDSERLIAIATDKKKAEDEAKKAKAEKTKTDKAEKLAKVKAEKEAKAEKAKADKEAKLAKAKADKEAKMAKAEKEKKTKAEEKKQTRKAANELKKQRTKDARKTKRRSPQK